MGVQSGQIWQAAARMHVRLEKAWVRGYNRHGTTNQWVAAGCPEQRMPGLAFVYEVPLNLSILV